MIFYSYITSPTSGTVHLFDPKDSGRTLCGLPFFAAWKRGVPTETGNAATCSRCKKSLNSKKGNE